MQNTTATLKVGLIVDSVLTSKYIYDLAQWGQTQDNVFISHLLIQNTPTRPGGKVKKALYCLKNKGLLSLLREVLFACITTAESVLLKYATPHKEDHKLFDLKKVVAQSIDLHPLVSSSGLSYRYTDDEIEHIKGLNLDLLIRCGSGILRGRILEATRFGIISFHHADNRVNRGGPAGFWEVYFKQHSTGFVIQRLTEELDGGDVLIRGYIYTKLFYRLNKASLYTKSNYYLKKLLSDIAITQTLPPKIEAGPYFNPLFKKPTLLQQLNYIAYLGITFSHEVFKYLILKKRDRWGVAYASSDWKSLVMRRAIKIKNPPNHFLADPFVIIENDTRYCFVEDYDYKRSKGCISVYQLNDKSAQRLGEVIVEPFHMSFPYIFRFNSKIYLCPETARNKDIRLYEAINFPLEWKLAKVLMTDISAVDTLIFEHEGLWWMLTNIDPVNAHEHFSELFIFYADNPLSDKWHAHAQNPILIEEANARNAGILYDNQSIYRVAQKREFNRYGKGFSINKIVTLNKNEYCEKQVHAIEANFFPGLKGTHHLHSDGKTCVFDYVEETRVGK